ncbi:MAG: hypothetical protein KF763_01120 [Cyclobacteriaceae bacterium]|nr:hypothetical protein [Cyclobacteriaceae bacterium]
MVVVRSFFKGNKRTASLTPTLNKLSTFKHVNLCINSFLKPELNILPIEVALLEIQFTISLPANITYTLASSIYQQSIDKQRVIVTGAQSGLITSLVRHVLTTNQRKFDFVADGQLQATLTDAPVLIVEAQHQLADFHHHILLLSDPTIDLKELDKVADATPKGGLIIYPQVNKELKAIATRERPDVQVIPYDTYKHEKQQGKTILITSTNEKFPIALTTASELACISAARELLKKIGISSGQFYRAVSTFQP